MNAVRNQPLRSGENADRDLSGCEKKIYGDADPGASRRGLGASGNAVFQVFGVVFKFGELQWNGPCVFPARLQQSVRSELRTAVGWHRVLSTRFDAEPRVPGGDGKLGLRKREPI
jgi:hypothetical protein